MGSPVISTVRYRNARSMIDWLSAVFGFERHLVIDAEDGGVAHAQLVLGSGMIRRSGPRFLDSVLSAPSGHAAILTAGSL